MTTSTLLPDEFEFFQQYQGEHASTSNAHRAHVGPIHRLMWIAEPAAELQRFISAAEDGDVRMWYENHDGTLVHMR